MPRGASPKREREYEALKGRFQRSGRYKGREKEVAARIVNKQRRQYGETRAEERKDREGKSPDRSLPIKDYQGLTVGQIKGQLQGRPKDQLRKIRDYERSHKQRKTLLAVLDRQLG